MGGGIAAFKAAEVRDPGARRRGDGGPDQDRSLNLWGCHMVGVVGPSGDLRLL